MIGWRVWRTLDGQLVPLFEPLDFIDPRTGLPFGTYQDAWPAHDWLTARCPHGHVAPDPACGCGIHVLSGGLDALSVALRRQRATAGKMPWAIGAVECDGRIAPATAPGDPKGTLRVERARVVGPLLLSLRAQAWGTELADRYGCRIVDPSEGWGPWNWMPSPAPKRRQVLE